MKNAGTSDNINNDVSGQANLRIRNLVKACRSISPLQRKYRANLNDRKTRRLIWYSRGDNEPTVIRRPRPTEDTESAETTPLRTICAPWPITT